LEPGTYPTEAAVAEVEGWRDLLEQDDPEYNLPKSWHELPQSVRLHARFLAQKQSEAAGRGV
jgi:hypothetical protein